MKQVVDQQGNKLSHHYRNGSVIVVDDQSSINLFKKQQEDRKRLNELEGEVDQLKLLLQKLLEKNNV